MRKSRIRIIFWIVMISQCVLAGSGTVCALQSPVYYSSVHAKKEVAPHRSSSFVDQYFDTEETLQEKNYKKPVQHISSSGFQIFYTLAGINGDIHLHSTFLPAQLPDSYLFILHRNIRI